MSFVFVVDTNRQPLNPVHPGHARFLLKEGKAAVLKRHPFTIVLKRCIDEPQLAPLRLKLDPGSKTTGIALVDDQSGQVVFAAELSHRGQQIRDDLLSRRGVRRSRRRRQTRYRKPRFHNRSRPEGWLAPSLQSRISTTMAWVARLRKLCPIEAISMELVKFDTQHMETPEICGMAYQQGTLAGYEIREYLLEKWGHQCAYCGKSDVPLQIEHLVPKARGGTDRVSNLTLACEKCNRKKGTKEITVFLQKKPDQLKKIQAQARAPLKDAAAVNTTRQALFSRLKELGLPLECGSGGRTKCNRTRRGLPKTHWLDAACVGTSTPEILKTEGIVPLCIKATGHGSRHMCLMDRFGFPRTGPKAAKRMKGYQTGDLVRAVVPPPLKTAGTHIGRVKVRATGSFDIRTSHRNVAGVSYQYCRPIHRNDGYSYTRGERFAAKATNPTSRPA
jgi:5-methylcytosine-specific restriction endonuclease McrA